LVEKGVWSPEAALASLRQLTDLDSRTRAISALAPHVPPPLLEEPLREALTAMRGVSEQRRSDALSRLGPHLPSTLMGDALEAAAELEFGA
jgi:hypothetical protein